MQAIPEQPSLVSKTKLKAEADAAQAVGQKLITLPKEKLLKLALPESVLEAVLEARRITSNGAIRRQKQYLGRLMRELDTTPIIEQLQKWEGKHQEENARFHGMERWRTRLMDETGAVSEFIQTYPHVDSQQLRTLIRNAQREVATQSPPKASRALFKLIRETLEAGASL